MMHLVRTPDGGLGDPSHSWFDGVEHVHATDEEIAVFVQDDEDALA